MTPQEAVNGPVFRAINLLIDQEVGSIKFTLHTIQRRVTDAFSPTAAYHSSIDTRVSYEPGGRETGRVDLGVKLHELADVGKWISQVVEAEKRVNELMRFKCRLMNDYDFTKGDPAEQVAVFGAELSDD